MIKKKMQIYLSLLVGMTLLSSCYSYTEIVGRGPQSHEKTKKWNHYAVYGLAPIKVVNSKETIGSSKDYSVNVQHSFLNGLIAAVTFGLYTPTTVTVTK